jgi:hypothetical protein
LKGDKRKNMLLQAIKKGVYNEGNNITTPASGMKGEDDDNDDNGGGDDDDRERSRALIP